MQPCAPITAPTQPLVITDNVQTPEAKRVDQFMQVITNNNQDLVLDPAKQLSIVMDLSHSQVIRQWGPEKTITVYGSPYGHTSEFKFNEYTFKLMETSTTMYIEQMKCFGQYDADGQPIVEFGDIGIVDNLKFSDFEAVARNGKK